MIITNVDFKYHVTTLIVRRIKEKGGVKLSWSPVGPPGTEAFLSSCRQDSSLYDLAWDLKGRFEQLLIKGGTAKKPREVGLKGPRSSSRLGDHLRPCTHPNLVNDPTLGLLGGDT